MHDKVCNLEMWSATTVYDDSNDDDYMMMPVMWAVAVLVN